MFIETPKNSDINDAAADLGTALTIARACNMLYFEEQNQAAELFFANSRADIHEMLGAVIDYIRSAKSVLDSLED